MISLAKKALLNEKRLLLLKLLVDLLLRLPAWLLEPIDDERRQAHDDDGADDDCLIGPGAADGDLRRRK